MTRKRKIKKFIFSILGCLSLGLASILPFINSKELLVSAQSNDAISYDTGFVSYDDNFDLFGNTYLEMIPLDNDSPTGNNIKCDVHGGTAVNGIGLYTTVLIQYNRDSTLFGDEYGFRLFGFDSYGYFNGFKIYVSSSSNSYKIYICDIYESGTNMYSSRNDVLIFEYSNNVIQDETYNRIILDNLDTSLSFDYYASGSITSVGSFMSWWADTITFYSDYNLTKWHGGSVVTFNFVDLLEVYTYYDITDDLMINIDNGILEINYNDLTIIDIHNDTTYYKDNLIYLNFISTSNFSINNIDLNTYHFIRSLFSIYYYPSDNDTNLNFNFNYYKLDFSTIDNLAYYVPLPLSFTLYNYSYTFSNILFENDGSIKFEYLDESGNPKNIEVYSLVTNQYLNNFTYDTLIITVNNSDSYSMSFNDVNLLNNILVSTTGYPTSVKGWYTFDMIPFANLTNDITVDIPISFTSNSTGFNSLRIVFNLDILGSTVGVIYFDNINDNNELISRTLVYQYELRNGKTTYEWTSVNYRQLYIDNTLLSGDTINLLDSMGAFTFISNNTPDGDYTLTDLFWSVAEVPIVTIRKMFDFEILGTNVTNFVLSLFTIGVIFFLIRKLF